MKVSAGGEDDVVDTLEEEIIYGDLAPGTRLVEDALLARFPVSRHAIRQALMRLQQKGIVHRERNRGARVIAFTEDEVQQIYEVRELIQRQAALRIPLPAAPELVETLIALNAEFAREVKSGNRRGIHLVDDRFHSTLFEACRNKYLRDLVNQYMNITLPIRKSSALDADGSQTSIDQHATMISMLRKGDSWAFAELCVDHIHRGRISYLKRLAARPLA
ncbi:hypothetical protein OPKNFCMD_6758 [Methylobacterium crusticola]|uniref:HTH gntR-type domain-containing protein n=1 Tax=Methylobacterium crusticola TaxID=1697972 RepID=A0ABQ4R8C1_9HYPH|nr:GntR family transcriptional regulator [Methylobacterium crusticola]GJD53978.1 hypothetical protein OPKNFCMD_6758 [Methylobacterium crusticola]